MGNIDYSKIYNENKENWKALTEEPHKYEALLAGHYSDSNHFVYELLQNAEDEKASRVVIEYYKDKLVFYHNGEPFDEGDVRGVSSMLMGTKDRFDAQTIGRFGMGFKSVFKYTNQPVIYSDHEAFMIKNYLLPVEITEGWDYEHEKANLQYRFGNGKTYFPFFNSDHLTKIVIPFVKTDDNGVFYNADGKDVLQKLSGLNGEILLFLTYIKDLYWINKQKNHHVRITLSDDKADKNIITCRITGSSYVRDEVSRYLRYKKVFNHVKMKSAEVAVAYKLNAVSKNVNEMGNTPVWVYFPTRDMTALPFLIHGSFETAVSREKLMTPSGFNSDLMDKLGDLIAESLTDMAKRLMITQAFIRRVLIAAFKDEESHHTIPDIKKKVTDAFIRGKLLPDRKSNYRTIKELTLPVPFQMAELCEQPVFAHTFDAAKHFVAFNNEKERNFTEYFLWLKNDLKIPVYSLADWAAHLTDGDFLPEEVNVRNFESIETLYNLLNSHRLSLYTTGLSYTRAGAYDVAIKEMLREAWNALKEAPLILNKDRRLVPAYKDKKPAIYISLSGNYRNSVNASVILPSFATTYHKLFEEAFEIPEFDDYQFIKEKIVQKYTLATKNETIKFEDRRNALEEYASDIKQIISFVEESHKYEDMRDLLKGACIIKVWNPDGKALFARPQNTYLPKSDEGVDLTKYFHPVPNYSYGTYGNYVFYNKEQINFDCSLIDFRFFNDYGIPLSKMRLLGVLTTPVIDGIRYDHSGRGDNYWDALGEFCPNIKIIGLETNLIFIEGHPADKLAKEKSSAILNLLLSISPKLAGKIRRKKTASRVTDECATELLRALKGYRWLFDKNHSLHSARELSKYELDSEIYGELPKNKEVFALLGFVEKEEDTKADAFDMVEKLDKHTKKVMFRQLARELGYDLQKMENTTGNEEQAVEAFNPNDWLSDEFPKRIVRNMDYLVRHVREQFFCADPVKYQQVYRQIRTSKSAKSDREYSLGMYTNESNTQICQICKKRAIHPEAIELSNFGIEMPQLHICLCKDCASEYKRERDNNKEHFKTKITRKIRQLNISSQADSYDIEVAKKLTVSFTQTHIAEIKEILDLIDRYGLPTPEASEEKPTIITEGVPAKNKPEEERSISTPLSSFSPNVGVSTTKITKAASVSRTMVFENDQSNAKTKPLNGSKETKRYGNSSETSIGSKGIFNPPRLAIGVRVENRQNGKGTVISIDSSIIKVKYDTGIIKKYSKDIAVKNRTLEIITDGGKKSKFTDLKGFFVQNGLETIDKRINGGSLWVVGERDKLEPYIKVANNVYGAVGAYGRGKATDYRNGWFTHSKA